MDLQCQRGKSLTLTCLEIHRKHYVWLRYTTSNTVIARNMPNRNLAASLCLFFYKIWPQQLHFTFKHFITNRSAETVQNNIDYNTESNTLHNFYVFFRIIIQFIRCKQSKSVSKRLCSKGTESGLFTVGVEGTRCLRSLMPLKAEMTTSVHVMVTNTFALL